MNTRLIFRNKIFYSKMRNVCVCLCMYVCFYVYTKDYNIQ